LAKAAKPSKLAAKKKPKTELKSKETKKGKKLVRKVSRVEAQPLKKKKKKLKVEKATSGKEKLLKKKKLHGAEKPEKKRTAVVEKAEPKAKKLKAKTAIAEPVKKKLKKKVPAEAKPIKKKGVKPTEAEPTKGKAKAPAAEPIEAKPAKGKAKTPAAELKEAKPAKGKSLPPAAKEAKPAKGKSLPPAAKEAKPAKGKSLPPAESKEAKKAKGKSVPPSKKGTASAPPSKPRPTPRTPTPVIPKEPARPALEDRAEAVEARLQSQAEDIQREYQDRLYMSWIHHDSALEGVVYTFTELQTAVDPNITVVPDSSIQPICDEIRRHKAAIDFVRDTAGKKKQPLTTDIIKRIYLFFHPEEGDIKTVKYRKDIPQHRLYFHEYAAPDKIAYGVRQVVEWVNDPETKRTRTPIRIAARAHYDFLRVFPFQNDSGKVARLLMNYILLRAGFPPAIIHSTERQRYYDSLKGSPLAIVHMVQESLENSIASIEKYLDDRGAPALGTK
jgi:hypothetical protein